MLKPGKAAPEFALPDQDGREARLSALVSGGPLILYFYPADFTPGCTKEACDLRDLHAQIISSGLTVVGVSPQSPESHRRFREKYGLPFTLSMGCGTWQGNSMSENLSWRCFVNITHLVTTIPEDKPSEEALFGAYWAKYGK